MYDNGNAGTRAVIDSQPPAAIVKYGDSDCGSIRPPTGDPHDMISEATVKYGSQKPKK